MHASVHAHGTNGCYERASTESKWILFIGHESARDAGAHRCPGNPGSCVVVRRIIREHPILGTVVNNVLAADVLHDRRVARHILRCKAMALSTDAALSNTYRVQRAACTPARE